MLRLPENNQHTRLMNTVIDNKSIIITFKNIDPICVSLDVYLSDQFDLYTQTVIPYFQIIDRLKLNEGFLNEFYKNEHGIWINLSKVKRDEIRFRQNHFQFADRISVLNNPYVVSNDLIPRCFQTTSDKKIQFITSFDGTHDFINHPTVNIDEFDLRFDMINIKGDSFMKDDLKVTITNNIEARNLILSLNGVFVDFITDEVENNVFYIVNARHLMNTRVAAYKNSGNKILSDDGLSYTIEFEEDSKLWYYDFSLKIFKWSNISVSNFEIPIGYSNETVIWNRIGFVVRNRLKFNQTIDENKILLLCNGEIVDKEFYIVDGKEIILKYETQFARLLLEEMASRHRDPTLYVKDTLGRRMFHLLRLDTINKGIDPISKLTIDWENLEIKDWPYKNHVFCRNFDNNDLVLSGGQYSRFEYAGSNYLTITRFMSDNPYDFVNFIRDTKITRIRLLQK